MRSCRSSDGRPPLRLRHRELDRPRGERDEPAHRVRLSRLDVHRPEARLQPRHDRSRSAHPGVATPGEVEDRRDRPDPTERVCEVHRLFGGGRSRDAAATQLRGATSPWTAAVCRFCTRAPSWLASTTIADPGTTFSAPRIGVAAPTNQPVAARMPQACGSASGRTPANRGRAPRRLDHTQPSLVRSSYSLPVAMKSLTIVNVARRSSWTPSTNGGFSSTSCRGHRAGLADPYGGGPDLDSPTNRSQPVGTFGRRHRDRPACAQSGQSRRGSGRRHSTTPSEPPVRSSLVNGSA